MSSLRTSLREFAFRVPLLGPRYRRLWQAAESHYQLNPGHYASPIPSSEDIDRELTYDVHPEGDDLPGIPLRTQQQLNLLSDLAGRLRGHPFPADPSGNLRYHYHNDWFQFTDGLILHALARYLRPSRIVEIGSGFSSCVILDTIDLDEQLDTHLTMIEPDCGRLRTRLKLQDESQVTLLDSNIQSVSRRPFEELGENDILLVDSSHVSKSGSDVNLIVHEILPSLAPGVVVHFHDIFYPFTYPRRLMDNHQYWNEAYLLRAYLCENHRFEIMLWNDYLKRQHPAELADALGQKPQDIACSFWMRRVSK